MNSQHTTPRNRRTRVPNACQRCRKHKIKCSGTLPCKSCNDKNLACGNMMYQGQALNSQADRRATSGSGGFEQWVLQQRQDVPTSSTTTWRVQAPSSGLHDGFDLGPDELDSGMTMVEPLANNSRSGHIADDTPESTPSEISNPMVPRQPAYMKDRFGTLRYLGHSSTFSFSRQLLSMVHQYPDFSDSAHTPVSCDAEVYAVDACTLPLSADDLTNLPSAELATFYAQSLKFKTNPLFHLFDEVSFAKRMHDFYEDNSAAAYVDRTWYVHYLLVMAFGKALTMQSNFGSIAGIELFNRALRLLPDVTTIWRDLLTGIEIMCCIGLYLFSIDHRSAGYIYIGQALRMAHTEGLHTNVQETDVGSEFARRGRQVWWTVYSLDRRFSTSMGLPNSLREEDITAPFPSLASASINIMGQALHTSICQLLGRIIRTVYGADGSLNKTFLTTAQDVLRGIGGLADDIEALSTRCLGEVSRVLAHLQLAYHQCIIVCTRPFLLHLVKLRLQSANPTAPLPLSRTCKGIVQACVDSAKRIAMILSQLRHHQLIDSFLPFDLECGFSAALILTMTNGIHPKLLPRETCLDDIILAFDYMIEKGNIMAGMRKAEIHELARVRWSGRVRQHRSSDMSQVPFDIAQISPSSGPVTSLGDPFFDVWGTHDGLSGAQLVSLADALNFSTDIDLLSV